MVFFYPVLKVYLFISKIGTTFYKFSVPCLEVHCTVGVFICEYVHKVTVEQALCKLSTQSALHRGYALHRGCALECNTQREYRLHTAEPLSAISEPCFL